MRLAVVSLCLVAACSSSGSSSSDIMKAATDLATAVCNKRQSCTNGVNVTRTFGDMTTCLTRETLLYQLTLEAPSTGQNPTNAESCANAFASLSCADFLDNNSPAACLATGTKATNAPCAYQGQCSTTYCDSNKTTSCGTCGDAPAAGASCRNSDCARTQLCSDRTLTCYVPAAIGAACNADTSPCAFGANCELPTPTATMGTCVAESQELGDMCGGIKGACDQTKGLACLGTVGTRTCAAQTFAADGQPCGQLANGLVLCTQGECYDAAGDVALAAETGTCKKQAADGQACDIMHGPTCTLPARCVTTGGGSSGLCTLPSGMTCE
jgi:hypothetical protein